MASHKSNFSPLAALCLKLALLVLLVLLVQAQRASCQSIEPAKPDPGPGQAAPPIVTAGPDGFSIKSADGAFRLTIGGYAQIDYRAYFDHTPGSPTDEFLLRRIRPVFTGTLYRFIDFRMTPDFGDGKAGIQDGYIDLKFAKDAVLRAGRFKPFFGIDREVSTSDARFVERGLASGLTPNRDLGLCLWGVTGRGMLTYSVGIYNGVPDGVSSDGDSDSGKDVVGRVLVRPFARSKSAAVHALGVGLAMTSGSRQGTTDDPELPSYKGSGQQVFFRYLTPDVLARGTVRRLTPQFSWTAGPFGMYAEHITTRQGVLRASDSTTGIVEVSGWHVIAAVLVTGEAETFRNPTPSRTFHPRAGAWGALEIAGRVEHFAVSPDAFPTFADAATSAREARAWGLDVNWYLNHGVKFVTTFEHTSFRGGAPGRGQSPDREVLFSRMQVYF